MNTYASVLIKAMNELADAQAYMNGGIFMKDINFLVEERPFESNLKKEKKSIPAVKILVLILVIVIGTVILLAPGLYIRILEGRALAIENKLTDVKYSEARSIKAQLSYITNKIISKKDVINAIDFENTPVSQIILITQNALPSGCYLTSLSYSGKSFTIRGVAESSFIITDYMTNLERLDFFESSTQSFSLEESQSAIEFTITCTLKLGR